MFSTLPEPDRNRIIPAAASGGLYRDEVGAAIERRRSLLQNRLETAAHLPREVVRVFANRASRLVGGVAGLMGAAVTIGGGASLFLMEQSGNGVNALNTALLLGSVVVALVAAALTRILAPNLLRDQVLEPIPSPSNDPVRDVVALEREKPMSRAIASARRLETMSIGLPMLAWAILGPLTLHFLVFLLFGGRLHHPEWGWTDDFDEWMWLSAAIVGHSMLISAVLCWRFASRLSSLEAIDAGALARKSAKRILGIVVLSSFVPGILFIGIPPVLVALTGFAILPPMIYAAPRVILRERFDLEDHAIPAAPGAR